MIITTFALSSKTSPTKSPKAGYSTNTYHSAIFPYKEMTSTKIVEGRAGEARVTQSLMDGSRLRAGGESSCVGMESSVLVSFEVSRPKSAWRKPTSPKGNRFNLFSKDVGAMLVTRIIRFVKEGGESILDNDIVSMEYSWDKGR